MSEKTYFDTDGNKRSLNWMTRNDPEWAANVIRTVKVKNTELKELISTLVDHMIAFNQGQADFRADTIDNIKRHFHLEDKK